MREYRKSGRPVPVLPTQIPIHVTDESDRVHYCAGIEDVREIIKRLPAGVLDGIASIELCLGFDYQKSDPDSESDSLIADPLTGRLGSELIPGVFVGRYLGVYDTELAQISVFAYVFEPSVPYLEQLEILLRLEMLSTFVHEVAHHFDTTLRVGRGRWQHDNTDKNEIYAQKAQFDWVPRIIIPYLEERYPEQIQRYRKWIESCAGTMVPLECFIPEPNRMINGKIYPPMSRVFSNWTALSLLIQDLQQKTEPIRARLEFARELHYTECYEPALEIIARVRSESPNDPEALILEADIYIHQKRYDNAEPLLRQAISLDEMNLEAWERLADLHEGREDWPELRTVANHILKTMCHFMDLHTLNALEQSARAYLELGDIENTEMELAEMEQFEGILAKRAVLELRKKLDLRKQIV
jgi:tetratricopeptide (TPR) repeat protein